MDYLWSPWRFRYVSEVAASGACILCQVIGADPSHDRERKVLCRGRKNFVVLNIYPYTTGHTMISPYAHVADFAALGRETVIEMMELAQKVQAALAACYHPQGYNLGMNLGQCAGAGIAGHLHLHLLPRWTGDGSFMTTIAETRVLPEDLETTFDKLKRFFPEPAGG
jgi:ATP adenylyltransferase